MTTYVATVPLFIGNARAHNAGDEVPEENIARNGWEDSVARVGTAAAEAVTAGPFDPTTHSVEEVLTYLGSPEAADVAEHERVIAAERAGKARKSILGD